ncbi:Cyclin-B1-1 -like protein [Gossypium arboreum]|uniref:Cyclin-B1-1-like protein n=1 Tax=Gossypium arboreum TaxID=29729 RepID=A0A0B0N672_GOSAR|nr:Cyclin-B1-1 -like protein [Gossypium arboreum]
MRFFSTNLEDCRNAWSEQEEGFERTTVAAMVKKISITKKALIPGLIKPSRMSKGSQE